MIYQTYLFTDDTNIYCEANTLDELQIIINKELKELRTWLIVNRLSLNIDKTNFVIFHPYNKPVKQNITLKLHKNAISEKDSVKYLGIMIDSTLTWQTHIDKISKKNSRAIGLLYKIRPFINIKIMKTLYYSFVYPHLLYAIEVWGSADITHLNSLITLQKRVVRMITFSDIRQTDYSFLPSDPLFLQLEIIKILDIFKLHVSKFIYKCLNKTNPTNFHSWYVLSTQVNKHNTRSMYIDIAKSITTRTLFVPFSRTIHYGLKQLKTQGPKIWNNIQPLIRNNTSIKIFLKELKNSILISYI